MSCLVRPSNRCINKYMYYTAMMPLMLNTNAESPYYGSLLSTAIGIATSICSDRENCSETFSDSSLDWSIEWQIVFSALFWSSSVQLPGRRWLGLKRRKIRLFKKLSAFNSFIKFICLNTSQIEQSNRAYLPNKISLTRSINAILC